MLPDAKLYLLIECLCLGNMVTNGLTHDYGWMALFYMLAVINKARREGVL